MTVGESTYQGHGFNDSLPKGRASGTLVLTSQMVMFQSGDKTVSIPLAGAEIKLGGASDRLLFISHPSVQDWQLYTSDLSILKDSLLKDIPSVKAQLNKARGKRAFNWSLLVACLIAVVVVPLLIISNMGWVSHRIAQQVPAEWEHGIGETAHAQMMVGKSQLQSQAGKKALNELVDPLLSAVSSDRYEFQIAVVNNGDVNAFALPGGFIVINSALIMEAESADEVLGVLAHEIIHVTEQHGLRNIINTAGVFLLVDALLGDVSGILAIIVDAAPLLINQSYSRDFESEADEKGLALLEKANINPKGLVTFFEKLIAMEQEQLEIIEDQDTKDLLEQAQGFLSSHPATTDRIEQLEAQIENGQQNYNNYDQAFFRLKAEVEKLVANNEDNL